MAAARIAVGYGGRRQFVGDVAVVWMMALGSGVCTIKINVWLIVSKRIFLPVGIARRLYFFAREFACGTRQNQSLKKKTEQICPRAKKYDSLSMVP